LNCFPFGVGNGAWNPYAGFVYKNVPAFDLKVGDTIAYDTAATNTVDIQLDVDIARTTTNGGEVVAGGFTRVALNTQTPASSKGDTNAGNYDLRWQATTPFSFPGGGLIIRFSNPSATYFADSTCNGMLVGTGASDPSGFFVKRFYADADGLTPYTGQGVSAIGGFRVTTADPLPEEAKCQGKAVTISGSNAADTIRGTKTADVINALSGADKVFGKRGNDTICGGTGKDTIGGGAGRDAINGENGADLIRGGKGADTIKGGKGKDTMSGGPKDDLCVGGAGKDIARNC
jgi:Ca2+-binding RTX toxin-like protein